MDKKLLASIITVFILVLIAFLSQYPQVLTIGALLLGAAAITYVIYIVTYVILTKDDN